jgi:hypothetical protein
MLLLPISLYSHSIIPGHGNALNLQPKFFLGTIGDRAPVRQNNPLLICNRNFRDSESARFQRLSALIGRFSTSAATDHYPLSAGKYRQRQWRDSCAELNSSHRRSWRTYFPITL